MSFSLFQLFFKHDISFPVLKTFKDTSFWIGTSTGMYAWHQGTPNGPIQSFAVFVIHKWRAPEICQWGLLQKELYHWAMPWELSTSTPAEASLGHTQEDVTPTGERRLLKLNTVRRDAFFQRDSEARGKRNCISLCWKAFSPHGALKTTAGENPRYFFPFSNGQFFNSSEKVFSMWSIWRRK